MSRESTEADKEALEAGERLDLRVLWQRLRRGRPYSGAS